MRRRLIGKANPKDSPRQISIPRNMRGGVVAMTVIADLKPKEDPFDREETRALVAAGVAIMSESA